MFGKLLIDPLQNSSTTNYQYRRKLSTHLLIENSFELLNPITKYIPNINISVLVDGQIMVPANRTFEVTHSSKLSCWNPVPVKEYNIRSLGRIIISDLVSSNHFLSCFVKSYCVHIPEAIIIPFFQE